MTQKTAPKRCDRFGAVFLIFSMLERKNAVFSHIALFSVYTAGISSRNMTIPLAHQLKMR